MIRLYFYIGALVLGIIMAAAGTYRYMDAKLTAQRAEAAAVQASLEAERDTLADALRAAQAQRKKDQALLARRAAANAAAAQETARLRVALFEALEANREWASTPVPKEVRDALSP